MRLPLFLAVSFVSLLLLAIQSTPLTTTSHSDYGIFRSMGRLWAEGGVIYRDLFDHKGPLFFSFMALAFKISAGKWSFFILETLFLTVGSELMYRIGRFLGTSPVRSALCSVVFIVLTAMCCEGGCTVEEFSLPFQLLPLTGAAALCAGRTDNTKLWSFITGLCFGCVAMMRINDNAIICGLCIGIVIYLGRDRRWGLLCRCIALFLAGAAAAILPFVLYFLLNNALDDFLYATVYFPLTYLKSWTETYTDGVIIYLIISLCCTASAVLCYFKCRRQQSQFSIFFIPAALLSFIVFFGGSYYLHYFVMAAPVVATSILFADSAIRKVAAAVTIGLVVCLLSMSCIGRIYCIIKPEPQPVLTEGIPDDELGSVYLYNSMVLTDVLYKVDHNPAGKYMNLQDTYMQMGDERIRHDIETSFTEAAPLWIITETATGLPSFAKDYTPVDTIQARGNSFPGVIIYRNVNPRFAP